MTKNPHHGRNRDIQIASNLRAKTGGGDSLAAPMNRAC